MTLSSLIESNQPKLPPKLLFYNYLSRSCYYNPVAAEEQRVVSRMGARQPPTFAMFQWF